MKEKCSSYTFFQSSNLLNYDLTFLTWVQVNYALIQRQFYRSIKPCLLILSVFYLYRDASLFYYLFGECTGILLCNTLQSIRLGKK